jgi:hypothetical protein
LLWPSVPAALFRLLPLARRYLMPLSSTARLLGGLAIIYSSGLIF